MAAAYIKVYFKGKLFRTFGGNKKAVKQMRDRYAAMGNNYSVLYYKKG